MSSSITIGQSLVTVCSDGLEEQMEITKPQVAVLIMIAKAPGTSATITSGDATLTVTHSRWGGMDIRVEGVRLGPVKVRPSSNQTLEAAHIWAYGGAYKFMGDGE